MLTSCIQLASVVSWIRRSINWLTLLSTIETERQDFLMSGANLKISRVHDRTPVINFLQESKLMKGE